MKWLTNQCAKLKCCSLAYDWCNRCKHCPDYIHQIWFSTCISHSQTSKVPVGVISNYLRFCMIELKDFKYWLSAFDQLRWQPVSKQIYNGIMIMNEPFCLKDKHQSGMHFNWYSVTGFIQGKKAKHLLLFIYYSRETLNLIIIQEKHWIWPVQAKDWLIWINSNILRFNVTAQLSYNKQ